MKDLLKSILVMAAVVCAFIMGLQVGRTKEKAKIPNFQDEI